MHVSRRRFRARSSVWKRTSASRCSRDNRTVTLTEAGEELRTLPNRLYCSISSFVTSSISRALRSPASCTSSAPSPPPIAICRRSSTAFAPRTPRWRSSSRPATPPTLWRRSSPAKPTAIAGKPETLPGSVAFSMLENLAVVLIAPAPCRCATGDRRAPRLVDSALYHGRPGAGTSAHRAVVSAA